MDLPFLSETSVDELNFQLQIDETFKAFMFKTVSRPKLKLLFRCIYASQPDHLGNLRIAQIFVCSLFSF